MNFLEYLDQIPTSREERTFKKEIREKCGVAPSTLIKWVKGQGVPDVKSCRIISGLTGLPVEELWPVKSVGPKVGKYVEVIN